MGNAGCYCASIYNAMHIILYCICMYYIIFAWHNITHFQILIHVEPHNTMDMKIVTMGTAELLAGKGIAQLSHEAAEVLVQSMINAT